MNTRKELIVVGAVLFLCALLTCWSVWWGGGISRNPIPLSESLSAFITALVAVLGGVFALIKWGQDQRLRKAELLKVFIEKLNDKTIQSLCVAVEIGKVDFEKNEADYKATLSFFTYLCYALRIGLIDDSQFDFFAFQIGNVVGNNLVWQYLMRCTDALDETSLKGPYVELVKEAKKRNWEPMYECDETTYSIADVNDPTGEFVEREMFETPTIAIRINRLYHDGIKKDELYNVTRGDWRVNYNVVKCAKYALSIACQRVREVYAIIGWETISGQLIDKDAISVSSGRTRFIGTQAPDEIRNKFLGKSTAHLFAPGDAYPVRYFGFPSLES